MPNAIDITLKMCRWNMPGAHVRALLRGTATRHANTHLRFLAGRVVPSSFGSTSGPRVCRGSISGGMARPPGAGAGVAAVPSPPPAVSHSSSVPFGFLRQLNMQSSRDVRSRALWAPHRFETLWSQLPLFFQLRNARRCSTDLRP